MKNGVNRTVAQSIEQAAGPVGLKESIRGVAREFIDDVGFSVVNFQLGENFPGETVVDRVDFHLSFFVFAPASLPATRTICTTRRIAATTFFASPRHSNVNRCKRRKFKRRKKASTGETDCETSVKPQAPVAPSSPSGHYPPEMRTNAPLDVSLREKAKALFLQGASQAQIAESLGVRENTIKTWAHRYHWPTVKRSVKPILQTLVLTEQTRVSAGIQAGLEEEGRQLRKSLSMDLQRTAGRLSGQWASPDSIREELERAQVVRQVAAVASQVYGWDRESITSTVRVGAMGEEEIGEGEVPLVQVTASQAAQ